MIDDTLRSDWKDMGIVVIAFSSPAFLLSSPFYPHSLFVPSLRPHSPTIPLLDHTPILNIFQSTRFLSLMFATAARRFTRVGLRSVKQLGSTVSTQGAAHSQVGYILAVGAAGLASIALLKKHLSAQEPESGFLYTWYESMNCIIIN